MKVIVEYNDRDMGFHVSLASISGQRNLLAVVWISGSLTRAAAQHAAEELAEGLAKQLGVTLELGVRT